MSDWCARLIDQNATCPSTKTGTNAVRSGRWLLPWYGCLSRKTSPGRTRAPKKSRTDSTAHGMAPTWMGTCSAWATSRAWPSQMAVEKSRLELRICEYAVRSIASPISSTMAEKRWVRTEMVTGSSMPAVYGGSGNVGDPEEMGAERAGGERVVQPPIGGDKRAVANHRNREVKTVVHRASKARRELDGQREKRLGRVDLKGQPADRLQGLCRHRHRHFPSHHPLPQSVGDLHENKIRYAEAMADVHETAYDCTIGLA